MILIILKRLGNMPNASKILATSLVVFLILSASIFFLIRINYAKHLKFGKETIHIQRTQYGIPYIKAPSFQTAMYAWGYVTAQDRLFQLSFKRLIGKGRISKYLGRKAINVDKMFRELNFDSWAHKTAQNMKRENQTQYNNFANYAKGINDHVKSLTFLPIEFHLIGLQWESWTVSDIFLISKLLVWSQSQNLAEEYIRSSLLVNFTKQQVQNLVPFTYEKWPLKSLRTIVSDDQLDPNLLNQSAPQDIPKFNPVKIRALANLDIMGYLDEGRGSNSWVIHGNYTKSGFPLLANDPHLQNSIPHEWHQIRVEYIHNGKTVYAEGASMTGLPSIVGKTPYGAIALTTIYADTQDLYKQQIQDNYYVLDGNKIKLTERKQIIEIQNQPPLQYIVKETHRGPIISFISHFGKLYELDKSLANISLCWTGFNDQYETFSRHSHMAQIDNLEDLKKFLIQHTDYGPNMNVLYSTVDNHIGYVAIGSLPIRKNPISGNFIKDGTTSEFDWVGLIQKQQKLSLHDPLKGYIVTANNKPASSKFQNGIFQSSMLTARANRIDQLIRGKIYDRQKFTPRDMMDFQLDTVDVICTQIIANILQEVTQSREYLNNFNCDFTKDSYQATVYQVFFYQLYLIINPSKVSQFNLLASLNYFSYLYSYVRNFTQKDVSQNMKLAFDNTIKNLTSFYGTSNKEAWTWQKYHPDVIIHRPFSGSQVLKPFFEKRFGGRGNINTVNVAKMNKLSYGDFSTYHRANLRQILSHGEKSYWIGDTGVSQKFFSKHYDDQYKLFLKDEYLQIDFQENGLYPQEQL